MNPRETITGPTEQQLMHTARIGEAFELLKAYLHDAEGSTGPGEHQAHVWSTQHMVTAAVTLDIAQMFAEKAVRQP